MGPTISDNPRPWNRYGIGGVYMERAALKSAWDALSKEDQDILEAMREGFKDETGAKRFGRLTFLELIFKITQKDKLDQLAQVTRGRIEDYHEQATH